MLDRLENELNKWLKRLEVFLDEMRSRETSKLRHQYSDEVIGECKKIIARREKMKEIMRLKVANKDE